MSNPSDTNWRKALREEPLLDDVLADPIIRQLMVRDGVSQADVFGLVARVPSRQRKETLVSEAA